MDWIAEVKRLELRPGNVLVIRSERPLREEEAAYLSRVMEKLFEGQRVIVLQPGLDLEVVGKVE